MQESLSHYESSFGDTVCFNYKIMSFLEGMMASTSLYYCYVLLNMCFIHWGLFFCAILLTLRGNCISHLQQKVGEGATMESSS